jgi:hypothetical protein
MLRHALRAFMLLAVLSALAAGAFLALGRDGAQASPDPTITVNGYDDFNSRDGQMTLREAILLATGDLSVTALSQAECIRTSTASWDTTLGCSSSDPPGASSADTIVFDTAIFPPGSPKTITLNEALPRLDTGNDAVDGSAAGVIVDGETGGFDCFAVASDNNTIKGLQVYSCNRGIWISGSNNTVGGSAAAEGNVISDNIAAGVLFGDDSIGNVVQGNYIGTNAAGDSLLGNGTGVSLGNGAQNNTIGGSSAAERNVISGNDYGVQIGEAGTSGNAVKGNYIGTNVTGDAALPNQYGVLIGYGAQNNTIGGSSAAERNVISGNDFGVVIRDAGTNGNTVKGNYIGINTAGTAIIPDTARGVLIAGGAQNNTVGGGSAAERNVISGNGIGVDIENASTSGNTVKGNYIGTNAAGTAAVANGYGVALGSGAQNNTIGGSSAAERNVISGNNLAGVLVSSAGTNGNAVKGNYIGTNAAGTATLPNNTGVYMAQGAQDNTIGGTAAGEGNLIAFNTSDGVRVSDTATTGNTIRGNSIHSNGGKGIHNDGGNAELAPPVITGFGSVIGSACPNCTIDVYSDDEDEGRVCEGSTTADNGGDWTFDGSPQGPNVTATGTDAAGNTSEFSAPVAVPQATPTPTPSPTATPPAGSTRTLQWSPGWHNATWSGPGASAPQDVFSCAASKFAAAYRFMDTGLERNFPDRPDISNMGPLNKYDAFFILITQPVTCTMPVTADSGSSRTLQWGAGWQNAGWSGADGTPPQDAFACADGSYAAAYRFTDTGLERYFPDRPDISNMAPLNKYDAFLILVTAPVSCTMAIAP